MFTSPSSKTVVLVLALFAACLTALPAFGQRRQWGGQSEFGEGFSISLNDDNNDLKLAQEPTPVPNVWVPLTALGQVARIDAATGEMVGRYVVQPQTPAADGERGVVPFRITVDKAGNCWVANGSSCFLGKGKGFRYASLVRIGIVIGGQRVDADGNPDERGEYLKPPFIYNTCIDRDGDGLIRTSSGDPLGWNDFGSDDTCGGLSAQEDECVTFHEVVPVGNIDGMTFDTQRNLWITSRDGSGEYEVIKLDGETGEFLDGSFPGCGGENAVIDAFGTLWSSIRGLDSNHLRLNTLTFDHECATVPGCVWGWAVDPVRRTMWATSSGCGSVNQLLEIDRRGNTLASFDLPFLGGELVVGNNGHIWVAEEQGTRVAHYAPNPSNPAETIFVGTVTGLTSANGIAVDSFGNLWVPETDLNQVSRINPNLGIARGSIPVGQIDRTIDFGSFAFPAAIGDMTGHVILAGTSGGNDGTWDVVFDSESDGTPWGTASWNLLEPLGTRVEVFVRAANDRALLPTKRFIKVNNRVPFTGQTGRFIEVKSQLERFDSDDTPVVFDIVIEAAECFLLIGGGRGSETWSPGPLGHEFATQLSNIRNWRPVLLESNPEFTIKLPEKNQLDSIGGRDSVTGRARKPWVKKSVQVVMWNPGVFPENPEQFTCGLDVFVWPDGTVTSTMFGERDSMDLEVEVVSRTESTVTLKIPFRIDGM